MNVLSTWLFLAIILVLASGIFLWPLVKRNRSAKKINHQSRLTPVPLYNQEFSRELTFTPAKSSPSQPLEAELPHQYGVDRMVLMARDPHWLYAYWEVTATKQEDFNHSYGGPAAWSTTHPVLRVYDITGIDFNGNNAHGFTDIHIGESTDNWYVEVGQPDRTFCIDLGRMFPDGRFVTLLRSNIVTTPRASLSDRLDEEWMWIEGLYRSIGRFQYGTSSPMIIEELALRAGVLPLGISSPGFNQNINE
ncbi:MAG: hypothetical protein A4E53_03041 [Pelotomaculum sp. PtaB.Bin104]|nr:MAG: hypothetical protein A4E53_03041 [Pelotomaculum sp. PtaB.Bin104]